MKIVGNLVANAKETGTSFPASHLSCLLSCYLPTPLQLRQRDGLVRAGMENIHGKWRRSVYESSYRFYRHHKGCAPLSRRMREKEDDEETVKTNTDYFLLL